MYDLFKPLSSLYVENGLTDKPVRYDEDFLKDVIKDVESVDLTKKHTNEVIGSVSNFMFVDGILKCDVSDNVDMSGYGLSPQFRAELVERDGFLQPINGELLSVGLTKTPRTHILNNSEVGSDYLSDEMLQQTMRRNAELEKEMAQKDNELESLKQKLAKNEELEKKYSELEKKYSKSSAKLEELTPKAKKYDEYSAIKRDKLLDELAGDSDELRSKYESFDLKQLEVIAETRVIKQEPRGVSSRQGSGNGNPPNKEDDEEGFDRDKFRTMYEEITGEEPKYI